jgi:hypothetical protein
MPIQKIGFVNGLDKDSDLRYLQNAYRDAFNVRITDYAGGNSLAITNVKGNTEKTYTLPTGHNYVIGSYDDKLNKNVYYFVYNSEDSHSILKYDYTNDVVEKVLEGDLEFSLAYFIDSVALLDNRFLIYTDDNTEPRWVDLDNLSKYSDPVVVPSLLDIAKPPQEIPCYANYTTNSEKKYNNLNGKLWQFRTVYVYKDGTRSAFSTISKLPLPTVDSQAPFVNNQNVSLDNEIVVTIPSPPQDVDRVEFYVQGVNSDDVKTTNWYLFRDELATDVRNNISNKYGINFADYNFANDGVYQLADPLDVAQAQTYIPKKAKALDILYGNRLGIANFYDGEDISGIELECTLSFIRQDVPTTGVAGTAMSYGNSNTRDNGAVLTNDDYGIAINNTTSVNGLNTTPIHPSYDLFTVGGTPVAFDEISFTLTLTYNVFNLSGLISTANVDFDFTYLVKSSDIGATVTESRENVAIGVSNAINSVDTRTSNLGGIIARSNGINVRIYQGQNVLPIGTTTALTTSNIKPASVVIINLSQIPSLPSFKKEATHEFGIEYSDDKGRRSTVITNSQLSKRTPAINGLTSTDDRGRVTAQIEIYHTPPTWATTYSIMYSKNLSYDYFLYFIGEVTDESATATNLWSVALEDLYRFRLRNQGTPIAYTFQKGDIIQFIESVGGTYVKADNPALSLLNEEGATTNRKIYFNYDPSSSATPLLNGSKYLFEIRRPQKQVEEKLFYEIGHTYPIENSFHTANTQNQTSTLPAVIDLNDVGDVYYKRRNFVAYSGVSNSTEFVESEYFSDYYDSAVTSVGRSSVVDDNFKEIHRKTSIVYSQPYIPNTNRNGIATVYDSSIEQYSTSNGSIQRIYQDDRRLFVFQERKVGVIGINQQFLLNGANQTYETDAVLTPIQYYPAEYGIGLNPESFSVYGYRKYFVDTVRGSVLRLSQDGITPISDVNMRGFFNSLFSMIDPQRVRVVYDKNNDELVLMHNEKDFAVNLPTSTETDVSCTIQLSKASFPQLDQSFAGQLCLYIKSLGESGTEYLQRTATISSVTSFNSTTWSVGVTFTALNSISYSVQYARKCTYNVITFNEQVGKWISRWDYKPDWMEECGIGMVSFKDGGIWIHDKNNTRGSFYGDEYEATITVIANQSPSQPKTFRNVQLESLNIWDSADSGDVRTPEGQSSSIAQANYIKRNNQHFAPMLRDINTANRTDALFNGNPMTSTVLILKLNNSDTTPVKLFSVGVGYFDTNLSNFNG